MFIAKKKINIKIITSSFIYNKYKQIMFQFYFEET
jgi:hypothetical protein